MEILHAGNKSSKYSRCGGAASYLQWWPYCLSVWVAAHCGRAFRMAFTSSATAVSANSNWSCSERRRRGRVRQGGLKHNRSWIGQSFALKSSKQTRSAVTVPWCKPSLVSGPGCAQGWQRCRSPSHLERSEQDGRHLSLWVENLKKKKKKGSPGLYLAHVFYVCNFFSVADAQ